VLAHDLDREVALVVRRSVGGHDVSPVPYCFVVRVEFVFIEVLCEIYHTLKAAFPSNPTRRKHSVREGQMAKRGFHPLWQ
jgi:hypothetical protein